MLEGWNTWAQARGVSLIYRVVRTGCGDDDGNGLRVMGGLRGQQAVYLMKEADMANGWMRYPGCDKNNCVRKYSWGESVAVAFRAEHMEMLDEQTAPGIKPRKLFRPRGRP